MPGEEEESGFTRSAFHNVMRSECDYCHMKLIAPSKTLQEWERDHRAVCKKTTTATSE